MTAMKKMTPAASPDAYVEALDGWRRKIVTALRSVVRAAPALDEVVKWGTLSIWRMDQSCSFVRRKAVCCSASGGANA